MPCRAKELGVALAPVRYCTVSCSEGNEHAPHGNEGQMRRDTWPIPRGRSEAVEWLGHFISPSLFQSGQMNPRGEAIDQDCLWSGIGSEYSTIFLRLKSSRFSNLACILIYFDNYGNLSSYSNCSYSVISREWSTRSYIPFFFLLLDLIWVI